MVVMWLWRCKWRRLGFVKRDEDDFVLASLSDVLLTFQRGPLYKSCLGGRGASESMPYDRSCERSRSHETPSFAMWLLVRLLLISPASSFTSFHVLT
jgi:hypothetical protein